jgi:hypothetical protein
MNLRIPMMVIFGMACSPASTKSSDDLDLVDQTPDLHEDTATDTGADSGTPVPEGTGVQGTVRWLEGNHMPGAGTGDSWPVQVPVALYEPLPTSTPQWDGDPEAYGLYLPTAEPLFETMSDADRDDERR